jgi:hypothetical protein
MLQEFEAPGHLCSGVFALLQVNHQGEGILNPRTCHPSCIDELAADKFVLA